ncbi:hypothetical protein FB451DRAFT_1392378 [Mycena latifolia]|nr:hypothetical protein FB451DRAFT_1392378 [Mycena latifolia]
MQFLTQFVLTALLSVAAAQQTAPAPVSESLSAEPGFTWCYDPYMSPPCINASTPPDQCINIASATHPDNDKASSSIKASPTESTPASAACVRNHCEPSVKATDNTAASPFASELAAAVRQGDPSGRSGCDCCRVYNRALSIQDA